MASLLTKAFGATGVSQGVAMPQGYFNASLSGTFVGTAQLERCFDQAGVDDANATWIPCSLSPDGSIASYSAACSVVGLEPEAGVRYRWNCTAYTSGTINARIGK